LEVLVNEIALYQNRFVKSYEFKLQYMLNAYLVYVP